MLTALPMLALFPLLVAARPPLPLATPECLAGDAENCIATGQPAMACELGWPEGCADAGAALLATKTPAALAAGRALLEKGCAVNHARSCLLLGESISEDPGQRAHAFAVLHQAARLGENFALIHLAQMHLKGPPVDVPRAAARASVACERGSQAGCYLLGLIIGKPVEKLRVFMHACLNGYQPACEEKNKLFQQGIAYDTKVPLPRRLDPAASLDEAMAAMPALRRVGGAAEPAATIPQRCGEPKDQCAKGDLASCEYEWSAAVAKAGESDRAYCAQTAACDRGAGTACRLLGTRLLGTSPLPLPSDPMRALALFEKGCTAGDPESCLEAAQRDAGRKLELSIRACALDHTASCMALAKPFFDGELPAALRASADLALARPCGNKHGGSADYCVELVSHRAQLLKSAALEKQCAGRNAAACAALADEAKTPELAAPFLEKACALGSCTACNKLFMAGLGAQKDTLAARATKACQTQCRAGRAPDPFDVQPCEAWLQLSLRGFKADKPPAEAFTAAELLCKNTRSCDLLTDLFASSVDLSGGDVSRLTQVLKKACSVADKFENFPSECGAVKSRAARLPQIKACRSGVAAECVNSARNGPVGVGFLVRACDLKSGAGCAKLWKETRDPQRRVQAEALCQAGQAAACLALAEAMERKDPERARFVTAALELLGQGCDQGHAQDCSEAARVCRGQLQPSDEARARFFLEKGCAVADDESCSSLAWTLLKSGEFSKAAGHYLAGCQKRLGPFCRHLSEMGVAGQVPSAIQPAAEAALSSACDVKLESVKCPVPAFTVMAPQPVVATPDDRSWVEAKVSGPEDLFFDAWSPGGSSLYLVGGEGARHTEDGVTWSSGGAKGLYGVWGSSKDNVYSVGSVIQGSTDQGKTWKELATGELAALRKEFPDLRMMAVGGRGSDVYVVGNHAVMLHSPDQGATWKRIVVTGASGLLTAVKSNGEALFVGTETGVSSSTDQGETWAVLKTGTSDQITSLWGTEGKELFAAGSNGLLLKGSRDGDWTRIPLPETGRVMRVWGSSSLDFYCLVEQRTLLHTVDGGTSWRSSTFNKSFFGLAGASANDVYLAGQIVMHGRPPK